MVVAARCTSDGASPLPSATGLESAACSSGAGAPEGARVGAASAAGGMASVPAGAGAVPTGVHTRSCQLDVSLFQNRVIKAVRLQGRRSRGV